MEYKILYIIYIFNKIIYVCFNRFLSLLKQSSIIYNLFNHVAVQYIYIYILITFFIFLKKQCSISVIEYIHLSDDSVDIESAALGDDQVLASKIIESIIILARN